MIFKTKVIAYPLIDKYFEKSWKELTQFYEFTPKYKPKIFIIEDRKTIDAFMETKTLKWCKNGCIRGNIFLLNPKKYSQVTDREFDPQRFYGSIIHELSHHFYVQIANHNKPVWLNEGVALIFGDQLKYRKKPEKFVNFLKFSLINAEGEETVYQESGFVIEKIISKFGKEKILELIKSLRSINNNDQFIKQFNRVYGFELNYDNINNL
ncbi:hypothetical protein A3K55_02045 [Candidatus Shapirobacteria bacterium RBG_13_44_7]|uniref:Peptidase MA-like domain-containing protein n=1 Tax=Candidatus Shapirobacteria bacterium RBG_13_44_7 TaxID=1802149 RepID=A0A1F7SHL1_9BACT|nr:MAG: hypothetical protein A3K55_02045 [Candidatus Shapirobacteria bacterium RBG_13_44_7]